MWRWVDLGFPGAEVRMLRIRGDTRQGAEVSSAHAQTVKQPWRLRTVVVVAAAAVPLTRCLCWC